MATYQQLRDDVLSKTGYTGQLEATTVVEKALAEAMKFVAFNVKIASLIKKATATAPASPELESNAIAIGSGGFNISDFQQIDKLFVKSASATSGYGLPYDPKEYWDILELQAIPSPYNGTRLLDTERSFDDTPKRWYTQTPDDKIWCKPVKQGDILTLFYRTEPAAYNNSNTPEISSRFNYILVKAGELALKEFLREPDQISTMWDLFEAVLQKDIAKYNDALAGGRVRDSFKIHRSYRAR